MARDQPTWKPALWKIRTEKPDSSPFHSYEDHTKGLQFLITRLQPEKIAKNKTSRTITLRNRQKPLCLHIAECFGHWRNKKHSSHAGMTNGCFRAGESVITESSSPTMRQMGKKLTRNMLRDALSLSQNWNCGNKYKRGLYICEYIHIIYIIYIYILCIYKYKQTLLETECPFLIGKKNSFARQNNKQKVSGVYVFIHIYIYIPIYISNHMNEWIKLSLFHPVGPNLSNVWP